MYLLILISAPFGILGYLRPSWWVLLVPHALWGGFALLETVGVLPGETTLFAVVMAGTLGSTFVLVGLLLGRTRRLRGANVGR